MFIVTAAGRLSVDYASIHREFKTQMPAIARHVVFHNFEKHDPDSTLDRLYRRAGLLGRDFRRDRWFERFENDMIRAIAEGDAQTREHNGLICVIPEPKDCDKIRRLSEFFGMAVEGAEADRLWPAFLDFSARMLLAQSVYLRRRIEDGEALSEKNTLYDVKDRNIGISDAFAVLWQIKSHGDVIVPFSERAAEGRVKRNDDHYRSEYALRVAYEEGATPEGRRWLGAASLSDIYARARDIWESRPRPSLKKTNPGLHRLLAAAAELDRRQGHRGFERATPGRQHPRLTARR